MSYQHKHHLQRLATDADQTEWQAFKLGSVPLDAGLNDDHMADSMDDFDGRFDENDPDWAKEDVASDSASGGLIEEIINRTELLGDAYPFQREGNSLVVKNGEFLTYKFCLAVSIQTNITTGRYTRLPRVFEIVAMRYTRFHFGNYCNAIHTGWPRQSGEPTQFSALAKYIHEETGEWFWGPEVGLVDGDSNNIKDAGIDFIAWLESPDTRQGKFFITGQCACGEDWSQKFYDAAYDKYRQWFNPVSWVKPQLAFCTPYRLVDGNLRDASHQGGIVYDRLRFGALAANYESDLSADLKKEMRECITLVK